MPQTTDNHKKPNLPHDNSASNRQRRRTLKRKAGAGQEPSDAEQLRASDGDCRRTASCI